jgi:hypothetical protein
MASTSTFHDIVFSPSFRMYNTRVLLISTLPIFLFAMLTAALAQFAAIAAGSSVCIIIHQIIKSVSLILHPDGMN